MNKRLKPESLVSTRGRKSTTGSENGNERHIRESILRILQKEGRVSGEDIGRRFKVSRTAIWKHIQELRKKGYEIDSAPRVGYTFVKNTDLLLPEEVGSELGTYVIGRHILYYDELPSSQDIAEDFARQGSQEGLVVIAERQTKGRGRKGRKWLSPAREGVYMSIVLKPSMRPSQVHQIPLVAQIAVSKAIKKIVGIQPKIRWPNDIMVNGKKVGGILTEMNCEIDKVNYVILGFGININTQVSSLPEPIGGIATSLMQESGKKIPRVKFVQTVLTEFESHYREFLASGFGVLRKDWIALSSTIGSWSRVSNGNEYVEGKVTDIDEEGLLILQLEDGTEKKLSTGDVS